MTEEEQTPKPNALEMARLEQTIHSLHTEQARLTAELARLRAEAALRERAIHAYAEQISSWEKHWLVVQQSVAWSLVMWMQALRTRMVPRGTKREEIWVGAVRGLREWRKRSDRTARRSESRVPGINVALADNSLGRVAREGPPTTYDGWARWCEELRYDRVAAEHAIRGLNYRPRMSIVMPVYNTDPDLLRDAIRSVQAQFYPIWELCVCDDASPGPHISQVLKRLAMRDSRIKVTRLKQNAGIVAASNCALEMATGEFVGLMDHDDMLTPDALYEIVTAMQHVDADLVYSDEDKLDERGRRHDPFFKPAWTPDLLLSCMYTGHLSVYRKTIVDEIGGFRAGTDGSQDHDLALRFTERTSRIVHIPKVLYHWRQLPGSAALDPGAKPYAYDAARRALQDAVRRRGIAGEVHPQLAARGFYTLRRSISRFDKVSIIIPTRDNAALLERCVASIELESTYPHYEIIIVDNGSRDEALLGYLRHSPHHVVRHDGPFNYAYLNNMAARQADGTYVLLLNDDTEVLSGEWLEAMLEHAQRPDVGAVGAMLLYPNGKIQHAGTILGLGGVAGQYQASTDGVTGFGYYNLPNTVRDYSAVTAACMMIRRDLYFDVGGLNDEHLPIAFNDVDLCLRLRSRGYLIIYTPYALLRHQESSTRGSGIDEREIAYVQQTWREQLNDDPYYHPCLSRTKSFALDLSKPDTLACIVSHVAATDTVGPLSITGPIGQEFDASDDYLSAVGLNLATYEQKCNRIIRFHLRSSATSEEDIRVVDIRGELIQDNAFHTFFFAPVSDSRDKRYYFYVETLHAAESGAIAVWKSIMTDEVDGPYFENHKPSAGTLSFRVYCQKHAFRTCDLRPASSIAQQSATSHS